MTVENFSYLLRETSGTQGEQQKYIKTALVKIVEPRNNEFKKNNTTPNNGKSPRANL